MFTILRLTITALIIALLIIGIDGASVLDMDMDITIVFITDITLLIMRVITDTTHTLDTILMDIIILIITTLTTEETAMLT